MIKRLLLLVAVLGAVGLGIWVAQGVTPGEVLQQLSGKAFAMLEKASEIASEKAFKDSSAARGDDEGRPHAQSHTDAGAIAPAVTVARVAEADFVERVLVTGTLVARDKVLITPEVEGLRVLSYEAEEGDDVSKGQVLARLERTTLESSLAQNTAAIARAEAAIAQAESLIAEGEAMVKEAEASLQRAKPLEKSGYLSGSTYDQREAAARSAEARLQSARSGRKLAQAEKDQLLAQRREIEWRLSRSEIRAPLNGLVSRRFVRIGDMASSAKDPMFEIIARGEIELEAEVDATNLAKVKRDQAAEVRATGYAPVKGKVRLVSPHVDAATRLGHARIFLGRQPDLKVGAFARGEIETAHSRGLSVPATAVLYDGNQASVLKVVGDRVRATPIEIGLRAHGRVEIRDGLARDDLVVAKAGTFLRDGDLIRAVLPEREVGEARP